MHTAVNIFITKLSWLQIWCDDQKLPETTLA